MTGCSGKPKAYHNPSRWLSPLRATPPGKRAQKPTPEGSHKSDKPDSFQIPLVEFHAGTLKHDHQFLPEASSSVMVLLILDIPPHFIHHGCAHRKGRVSFLPRKTSLRHVLVNPCRRRLLQFAHKVGKPVTISHCPPSPSMIPLRYPCNFARHVAAMFGSRPFVEKTR